MSTHNIRFCGEIRTISVLLDCRKSYHELCFPQKRVYLLVAPWQGIFDEHLHKCFFVEKIRKIPITVLIDKNPEARAGRVL